MQIRQLNKVCSIVTTDKEKDTWNKVANHPIQSWQWGKFRKETGNKIIRLGVFENKKLIEGHQLTVHSIPHTPYKIGVLLKGPKPGTDMLESLKTLAKQENLIFIRMEPNIPNNKQTELFLRQQGAKPGKAFFTKETFLIDLTKSEDELLKNMHPKTRYNIRVANRHGVKVTEDNSKEAFDQYLELTDQTSKRQNFFAHTERYHRLMWQTLKPAGIAHLLTAKYKGEILVTWIVFVWKDSLYYPYGASSEKHRNTMASYKMMWGAIKFGKKLGLKKFDLWGREEGKGFTKFKEGFRPEIVEFIGTWDLVTNPIIYPLYRVAEELRWLFLKLPLPLPKPKFR